MSDLVGRLRSHSVRGKFLHPYDVKPMLRDAANEIERLQAIIDNRPAINAGLPETYIQWSQSIYVLEISLALQEKAN